MVIGNRILRYAQVASTNDIAWWHADDVKNHGLVVLADEQTAGRGRRGDQWLAPPGSALLLSMLLHPTLCCRRPVVLTLWAALVVCRIIEEHLRLTPQLKWPNDVLIDGKKVCGILVEQRQDWVVVGVGLNVDFPKGWFESTHLTHASALGEFTAEAIDREELLQALLDEWEARYQELSEGKAETLLKWWRRYSSLEGAMITVEAGGETNTGRLVSLGWDAIVVEYQGAIHKLVPEAISRMVLNGG